MLTRNGSSPNVSGNLGHSGSLPTSNTGSKFHLIPDDLTSLAVALAVLLISSIFRVAARPIL